MAVAGPRAQPQRAHVARFYIGNTPVIKLYEVPSFRGFTDELNFRVLQFPFGGAVISGGGQKILSPFEINFLASPLQVEIEQGGYELSGDISGLINTLEFLMRQVTRFDFQSKKYINLKYQFAEAVPSAKSYETNITTRFLGVEDTVKAPTEWLSPDTLPMATTTIAWSYQLEIESDFAPITFTKVTGRDNLTVNSTGLLSWPFPDTVLTVQVVIRATDANGNTTDKTFTIPTQGGLYVPHYPPVYPFY